MSPTLFFRLLQIENLLLFPLLYTRIGNKCPPTTLSSFFVVRGKNPLNFAAHKPLDHVHVKCTQLMVWANTSTNVEYVMQLRVIMKYY